MDNDNEKTHRVVIYRLTDSKQFYSINLKPKGYSLDFQDDTTKLFVHMGKASTPNWSDYISPLRKKNGDIKNSNASFVLIKKTTNGVYAVTGGLGFHEVKDLASDDFGRNVALRLIDENEISSLNQSSMKGTTRQLIRAVAGYNPSFDRDNYNRILNSLSGKASFEGRRFRLSGKSSLILRTAKDIHNIGEVLEEIEEILKQDEKIHFPKSYAEVSDNNTLTELEKKLSSYFEEFWKNKSGRDDIYIEFKEPLAQFKCTSFKVTLLRRSIEVEEFDLEIIRDKFRQAGIEPKNNENITKKISVTGMDENQHRIIRKTRFYDLIAFETSMGFGNYIKFGRTWYKILDEIQHFIDEEISSAKIHNKQFPDWEKQKHPKEIDYNRYVASTEKWHCLDQDFIYPQGQSKFELCDIYDKQNSTFYHIKDTWGSKSAYLFTQGATAIESYKNSEKVRSICRKKWPHLFESQVTSGTVVFGIAKQNINKADFPKNMTYFAKLNLYNAISLIRQIGFEVELMPINII